MKLHAPLLAATLALRIPLSDAPSVQDSIKQAVVEAEAGKLREFETVIDRIRDELRIPAVSAAIVKNQKALWARGFGYADLENRVPATENTAYHLASLTKTFASTILMQLVKESRINLDDPISKYGIALESPGVIRVRHLFSHTSEGNPGERYQYNGNRFGELDKVVAKASGRSFPELLIERILDPLGLDDTAPNVPPQPPSASSSGPVVAEVKGAMQELVSAYNAGDPDKILKLVATASTTFRGDGGHLTTYMDAGQFRDAVRNGVRLKLEAMNLEVTPLENAAVATVIVRGSVTFPNGRPRPEGPWRATYVWMKEDGKWKIAHAHQSELKTPILTEKHLQRFNRVSRRLAQPYLLDRKFAPVKGSYPTYFSVSAGLISTVMDMAKYDIALDQNKLLDRNTQDLAWTATVSTKGETLPYGLGWFTQQYKGTKFIWHYGYWTCNSSLILKVPEKSLTFIVMADTDNLSRPTDLGAGDVTSSPMGLAFLKMFVFPDLYGAPPPEIDWNAPEDGLRKQLKRASATQYGDIVKKELWNRSNMHTSVGQGEKAMQLSKAHGEIYSKPLPEEISRAPVRARIDQAGDSEDKTAEFRLYQEQRVRVFAIGEGQSGEMFDFGWIEDAATGKRVWEMKEPETTHAGGAGKNRKIDTVLTLGAGRYRLRYKSDDSHSFNRWNAVPPDFYFWGIAVYSLK